jgi:hypothetical protein
MENPDCFDLNDWMMKEHPKEFEASKYLSPSSQYAFHLACWIHFGRPKIS